MASKNNTLKELFISLKLDGAKEAVKGLNRVESETEDADDSTEKLTKSLKKQGSQFRRSAKSSEVFVKAIRGLGRALTRLGRIASGVFGRMTRAMGSLARFTSLFGGGGVVATGIVGSILSLRATMAEETAQRNLALGLFLRGNDSRRNRQGFFGAASRLQNTMGVDADAVLEGQSELLKGGISLERTRRIGKLLAIFSKIRPDVDTGVLARQFVQLQKLGAVEETLKGVAPGLLALSEEQRKGVAAIELIEKTVSRFEKFRFDTLSEVMTELSIAANEMLKTYGRPISQNLTRIAKALIPVINKIDLTKLGKTVAAAIGTFSELLLGAGGPKFIEDLQTLLSKIIAGGAILAKDFLDFLLDRPNLLGKLFIPKGQDHTLINLIKGMARAFVSFMIDEIVRKVPRLGTLLGLNIENIGKSFQAPSGIMDAINKFIGPGGYQGIIDSDRQRWDPTYKPSPNPKSGASINFNNEIKITTTQPANFIRGQLDNQIASVASLGRFS